MKKTFVTTLPDHVGSFLKASRLIASFGLNITRVSYNKAIDSHTLFIEAEGDEFQLMRVGAMLKDIGYILEEEKKNEVMLIEFRLEDKPGSVCRILEIIKKYNFNISYISSQENGSEYQYFRMGLFIPPENKLEEFLTEASSVCYARIVEYDRKEKNYDNSVFYSTFSAELSSLMNLDAERSRKLLVNINRAVQLLDEYNIPPYKTFDSISKIALLLSEGRNEGYSPRVTHYEIKKGAKISVIEPPCGSNITIIENNGKYLFVDTGYACYREETLKAIESVIGDFDSITEKNVMVTHPDVDHCGLLDMFDNVYISEKGKFSLENEEDGKGFREINPLHFPYIRICKLLTGYESPKKAKIISVGGEIGMQEKPLTYIGNFTFGDMQFKIYEGKGGHVAGEIVLIDYRNKIAFTGDIYVNVKGFTEKQAEYNKYAPVLMTSVDTAPELAAIERSAFLSLLDEGEWLIFPGHGMPVVKKIEV